MSIFLASCPIISQEVQKPKGYIAEIQKDGNVITFLSIKSGSDKEFKDYYELIIGKLREKYNSTSLNCNSTVTAEVSEKNVGQKIYRLIWFRVDVKGKKEISEITLPIPKNEKEISTLPKDEQSIYKTIGEEEIKTSLGPLLSFLSCF